jgi:DNA-binding transcriptional regulator YiaG
MTGEDIVRIRAIMGLKNPEFAERIGISRQHLSDVETGKKPVSLKLQAKIFMNVIDTPEYRNHLRRLQNLTLQAKLS